MAVETSGRLVPKAQVLEQLLLLVPQVLRTPCGQGSADGKPETTLPGRALGLLPPPGSQASWLLRPFLRAASRPWFAAQQSESLLMCL